MNTKTVLNAHLGFNFPKVGVSRKYNRRLIKQNVDTGNVKELEIILTGELNKKYNGTRVVEDILTMKRWYKQGKYDMFVLVSKDFGEFHVNFDDIIKDKFEKYLEPRIQELCAREGKQKQTLHEKLEQAETNAEGYKKYAEQLKRERDEARQEARDERSKSVADYMRYEREIGEQQKNREKAEKLNAELNAEVVVLNTEVAQLREENEKLADRFSDDNLSIIMTLTKMGKTMDEIKEFMNL